MNRAPGCLLVGLLFASLPSQAATVYAADVWPSSVSVKPDGKLEYVYELRSVKTGQVPPDVRAEAGDQAVSDFLKSLPNEVRVLADPGTATLNLAAPGEMEHAAPVASFARAPAGPLAPTSEFDKLPPTAGLPALHHDIPKVLPSVDMLLWKSRQVEDGILAELLAASERGGLGLPIGRRAFWEQVLTQAVRRYREGQGNAKDGAGALASRIGAALRASQGTLPAAIAEIEPLARDAEQEPVAALSTDLNPGLIAAYGFSGEIANLENSEALLARPLPDSRAGLAGALSFLSILHRDPKLEKTYGMLQGLRDDFLGAPSEDVLALYRATATDGPDAALDNLGDFLPRVEEKSPDWKQPRLFSPPETPVRRFLGSLNGAERRNALDELAAALQDGRVNPRSDAQASWAVLRESALVPLLRPEEAFGGHVSIAGTYRTRLGTAFRELFHAQGDSGQDSAEGGIESADVHPLLKVKLEVPPNAQVEPLPTLYGRLASGYQRLGELLSAHGAAGLSGLTPSGGRRGTSAKAEAEQLARLYRGLELIALRTGGAPAPGPADQKAIAAAEHFLATWRSDPDLARSVRAGDTVADDQALAVTRRLVEVGFDTAPKVEVRGFADEKSPFVTDTRATQAYLVPVLTLVQSPGTALQDAP